MADTNAEPQRSGLAALSIAACVLTAVPRMTGKLAGLLAAQPVPQQTATSGGADSILRKPKGKKSAAAMIRLWNEMGVEGQDRAYKAVRAMVSAGDRAAAFLKDRLQPKGGAATKAHVRRLIAALDSPKYAERAEAHAELAGLGPVAEPACRQALARGVTAEVRTRLGMLLAGFRKPFPSTSGVWRCARGIRALEWIGTRAAQQVLTDLAGGSPGTQRTLLAQAALRRVLHRPGGEAVRNCGVNHGTPIRTGFLFIDGQYVDAPYAVERWGLDVYVNGYLFMRCGRKARWVRLSDRRKLVLENRLKAGSAIFCGDIGGDGGGPTGQAAAKAVQGLLARWAKGRSSKASAGGHPKMRKTPFDHWTCQNLTPTRQLFWRLGMQPIAPPEARAAAPAEAVSPKGYRAKVASLVRPQDTPERRSARTWLRQHLAGAVPYLLEARTKPRTRASRWLFAVIFHAWRRGLLRDEQKSAFLDNAVRESWVAEKTYSPGTDRPVALNVMGFIDSGPLNLPEHIPWDVLQARWKAELDGREIGHGETTVSGSSYLYLPGGLEAGKHTLQVDVEFSERKGPWRHRVQARPVFTIEADSPEPSTQLAERVAVYRAEGALAVALARLIREFSDSGPPGSAGDVKVTVDRKLNALTVRGRACDVEGVLEFLRQLDGPRPDPSSEGVIRIFKLKHAKAAKLAARVRGVRPYRRTVFTATDERTNTLIVSAWPEDMRKVEALIAKLDQPGATQPATRPASVIRSHPVRHGDPARVAAALRSALRGDARWRDEPVTITVDKARNALRVFARPVVQAVIKQLLAPLRVGDSHGQVR